MQTRREDCQHYLATNVKYADIYVRLAAMRKDRVRAELIAKGAIAGLGAAGASGSDGPSTAGAACTTFRGDALAGSQLSIGTGLIDTGPNVARDRSELLQLISCCSLNTAAPLTVDIREDAYFDQSVDPTKLTRIGGMHCFEWAKSECNVEKDYKVRLANLSDGRPT